MAAGRFGFHKMREFVRSALAALRTPEPVVFEEFRPAPPPELRLTAGTPPTLPPEINMRGAGWAAFVVSVAVHGVLLAYVLTHCLVDTRSPSANAPVSVKLVDDRMVDTMTNGEQTEAAPTSAAQPSAPTMPAPPQAEPMTTAALAEDRSATPEFVVVPDQTSIAHLVAVRDQTSIAHLDAVRDQTSIAHLVAVRDQTSIAQLVAAKAPASEKATAQNPREALVAELAPVSAAPSMDASETIALPPEAKVSATPVATELNLISRQPNSDAETNNTPANATTKHRKSQRHTLLGSHGSADKSRTEARTARKPARLGAGLSYRNLVITHLSARRPSSSPATGTVRIAFTLSASGQIVSAHVSRSAGKPELDRKALGAVRAASPYPSPPAGLSVGQRSFNIPFYFK